MSQQSLTRWSKHESTEFDTMIQVENYMNEENTIPILKSNSYN
jgi:hypothetical protein